MRTFAQCWESYFYNLSDYRSHLQATRYFDSCTGVSELHPLIELKTAMQTA
jgi:hypothetical protein